jgi:hypothetical protein
MARAPRDWNLKLNCSTKRRTGHSRRPSDDATTRLHDYLTRLSDCGTTAERDALLKEIREDVATIVAGGAHLEQHWLLRGQRMKPRRSYSRKILMSVTRFLLGRPSSGSPSDCPQAPVERTKSLDAVPLPSPQLLFIKDNHPGAPTPLTGSRRCSEVPPCR